MVAHATSRPQTTIPLNDLHPRRRDTAYELKFLLADPVAQQVLAWARRHLAADPHADPARGDGYRVSSLYLDTPALDVFHRVGAHGRRKFRVRRYGSESRVFLERKSKSKGQVVKRRTAVPEVEVARLGSVETEPAWPGHWYHRRMIARQLSPKCQIVYDRVARVGMTNEGPVRLTVDQHVRCHAVDDLEWVAEEDGPIVLPGQCILELKYRVVVPALFKQLIHEFSLVPASVSKYRLSMELCRTLASGDVARRCGGDDRSAGSVVHRRCQET